MTGISEFMGTFGWPVILVGIIFYLTHLRVKSHQDASKAAFDLLTDYRKSHEGVAEMSRDSISKLTEQFTVLLRHDAAMTAGQLQVLQEALSEKTRSNNDFALRLVQTFVVAHARTKDGMDPESAEEVIQDLSALNGSDPAGGNGSRLDPDFIPPMHQG